MCYMFACAWCGVSEPYWDARIRFLDGNTHLGVGSKLSWNLAWAPNRCGRPFVASDGQTLLDKLLALAVADNTSPNGNNANQSSCKPSQNELVFSLALAYRSESDIVANTTGTESDSGASRAFVANPYLAHFVKNSEYLSGKSSLRTVFADVVSGLLLLLDMVVNPPLVVGT